MQNSSHKRQQVCPQDPDPNQWQKRAQNQAGNRDSDKEAVGIWQQEHGFGLGGASVQAQSRDRNEEILARNQSSSFPRFARDDGHFESQNVQSGSKQHPPQHQNGKRGHGQGHQEARGDRSSDYRGHSTQDGHSSNRNVQHGKGHQQTAHGYNDRRGHGIALADPSQPDEYEPARNAQQEDQHHRPRGRELRGGHDHSSEHLEHSAQNRHSKDVHARQRVGHQHHQHQQSAYRAYTPHNVDAPPQQRDSHISQAHRQQYDQPQDSPRNQTRNPQPLPPQPAGQVPPQIHPVPNPPPIPHPPPQDEQQALSTASLHSQPPRKSRNAYEITHIIFPFICFLVFAIFITVTVVYTVSLQKPIPSRFLEGIGITFAVVLVSWGGVIFGVRLRRARKERERYLGELKRQELRGWPIGRLGENDDRQAEVKAKVAVTRKKWSLKKNERMKKVLSISDVGAGRFYIRRKMESIQEKFHRLGRRKKQIVEDVENGNGAGIFVRQSNVQQWFEEVQISAANNDNGVAVRGSSGIDMTAKVPASPRIPPPVIRKPERITGDAIPQGHTPPRNTSRKSKNESNLRSPPNEALPIDPHHRPLILQQISEISSQVPKSPIPIRTAHLTASNDSLNFQTRDSQLFQVKPKRPPNALEHEYPAIPQDLASSKKAKNPKTSLKRIETKPKSLSQREHELSKSQAGSRTKMTSKYIPYNPSLERKDSRQPTLRRMDTKRGVHTRGKIVPLRDEVEKGIQETRPAMQRMSYSDDDEGTLSIGHQDLGDEEFDFVKKALQRERNRNDRAEVTSEKSMKDVFIKPPVQTPMPPSTSLTTEYIPFSYTNRPGPAVMNSMRSRPNLSLDTNFKPDIQTNRQQQEEEEIKRKSSPTLSSATPPPSYKSRESEQHQERKLGFGYRDEKVGLRVEKYSGEGYGALGTYPYCGFEGSEREGVGCKTLGEGGIEGKGGVAVEKGKTSVDLGLDFGGMKGNEGSLLWVLKHAK